MFEKLKRNYLSSFEDKIIKIENALESSDIQVLSTLIHQMIGSSGSYGLIEISKQCTKIEKHILESPVLNARLSSEISQLIQIMQQEILKSSA